MVMVVVMMMVVVVVVVVVVVMVMWWRNPEGSLVAGRSWQCSLTVRDLHVKRTS